MDDIRVGIIGWGLAARVFHAPFVSAVPGLQLTTFVERNGRGSADAYPQCKVLRTAAELFADPEIDLVIVATPNETHYELARAALEAGKHVVVDKPFAGTSAEAAFLLEFADSRQLIAAPFHNRRWDGDFLTVKRLLGDGVLGRVATIESHFDRFRPVVRQNTWKEAAHAANGLLMDLGPHLLDQAVALFGVPRTLTASVRRDRDGTGIEDAFDIRLGYDRMLFWCRASMLATEPAPRFTLHGTHGSFSKYGLDPQEPALVAGATVPHLEAAGSGTWLEEPEALWGTLRLAPDPAQPAELTATRVKTERGDYRAFYANVRDAIRGEARLAVPAEAGFAAIKLIELARQSSAKGRTLEV